MTLSTHATGWRCPRCGRRFLKRTREHSCEVSSVASHLDRASAEVKETVRALLDALVAVGPHAVVPVKTMIVLRAASNFGGLVIRRKTLDVGFFLGRTLAHPRIHKTERIAPKKYAHHTRLSAPVDVDAQLVEWLREAYELNARAT